MHKLVYTVFKTIMLSMIFVFVFDMAFYLYRTMSLSQRMNNIMTSMQRVVEENNGLTPETYNYYEDLFIELADNYNGSDGRTFIEGFYVNYDEAAYDNNFQRVNYSSTSQVKSKMGTQVNNANYGDFIIVQVGVAINQPTWGFTSNTSHGSQDWQNDMTSSTLKPNRHYLWYTYFVPCLKYTG